MSGALLPLSPAQQGLFFAHELDSANPAYTTAEVVECDGELDAERLERAIALAYAEFEQIRTEFVLTPDGPRQRVRPPAAVRLARGEAADAAAGEAMIRAALERPLDLAAGETTRTGVIALPGARTLWWHAAHHVVCDGYAAQQLLRRIAERYAANGAGASTAFGAGTAADAIVEAAAAAIPLAALVDEDHREADSDAFWDERLARMTGPASLAGRIADPAPRARRRQLDLDSAAQQRLVDGARRLGVGWADLLTAAAGSYVARCLGVERTRIGLPLMNRALPGAGALLAARTVCTAMNVLPVVVAGCGSVRETLDATRAEQAEIRRHPFERQESLARRLSRGSGGELFGLQLNLIPFELELDLGGVAGTVVNVTAGPVEDLTLTVRGTPGRGRRVRLELDGHPDLYSEAELELHLERLQHWIAEWSAAEPDARVDELELLPAAELRRVLGMGAGPRRERDAATLGRRFAAQAERTPDAEALRFDGESRSYAELHEAARRIAGGLAARGVGSGGVVGVRLPRGFALYETIHAVALLGAVYLPVDPELPEARIETMLHDAAAACVVDAAEAARLRTADAWPGNPPGDLDAPAYLLFTSGSTGRPKGVLVSHRAIDNRLAWMQHHFGLAPGERVLHKTPISFDVSIWELFWPLQVGGAVVIAPPGAHRDPRAIARLVVEERIAALHFVPSMLRALLADRASGETLAAAPWRVRAVVTSGEALTADLVAGCRDCFGVYPTNLYGPTEAAVDVTVWDCTAHDTAESSVPIGRPVWNTCCLVLDAAMRPVPVGAVGELWLGGEQLAIGYAGRDDLTAERFVETRWGRLYRTGDLATWSVDGALRYRGRIDDQVKIRGQRVELGEIEAALAAAEAPGVAGVAAAAVDGRLVAWCAVSDAGEGSAELAIAQLKRAAESALPQAFVPSRWVAVPAIPLGSSGKADRRRLLAEWPPGEETVGEQIAGAAPRDLLEQRVATVFAETLGVGVVAADADFFELGGDSLSALRLIARLEDELGAELGFADAFAYPTPAALAARIVAGGDAGDFAEVLTLRAGAPGRAPLFLLPPAGGLGWCYTSLLPGLPRETPVHAIQAPGLAEGAPEPVADMTGLARRQLATIRRVVGDGPFHVAGWSLGGMAAHAVAALARSEGQRVGAVVLLDAYPAEQWQHLDEPTEAEALVGVLRLAGLDADAAAGERIDRETVAERLRADGSALASLPPKLLDGCIASVIEATRIVRTAPPVTLDGGLTLIAAAAPRPETHLDAQGWSAHVTGELRVIPLPVTHAELVRRPAAGAVAQAIAEAVA